MPTIPELVYAALLYPDNKRPENPPSEEFVEGVPNGDKFIFSFQRPDDTSGITFTLEVFAFVKTDVEADDGTKNFSINNAFLFGNKNGLIIEDDSDEIQVSDPIALSSGKPETVNLKIKVPDGCTLEVDDARFTTTQDGDDSNIYTVSASGIPVGSYPVTFIVKKGDEIVHVFPENINVLSGLCTDTWWNGSVSCDVKDVAQSISKTVYVRGTGGWYDATSPYNDGETAKASDDNLGSFSSPLATIQKAIDKVIAINDGESDYTINIDGTLKYEKNDENATYIGNNGMADFSTLDKKLNLTIKALSDTATLNGGAEFDTDGNVIDGKEGIEKNIIYTQLGTSGALNLTIKNLVITAGVNSRGVYIGSRCALIMNNCEISRISVGSGFNGGAVYVDSKGAFTMESSTISGCKANNGGGVYVADGGTFTMNSGTISDCTSASYGGGIYNICTFIMEDGTISENIAKNGGGGVFISSGTFTMKYGTISKNITKTGGGGVYVSNGTFTMSDGTISGNEASTNGGGVWNSRTFTMNGGTISGNKATNKGGGVYQHGTFKMSGVAKVESDNDVFTYNAPPIIYVTGELTASTPVATITPSSYTENRLLLGAGDGVTLNGSICNQFAVTPQNDGTEWRVALVGADGVLIRKYEMGDIGPGGGAVYYYDADGFTVNDEICHYLEVSKDRLGSMTWCPCTSDSGYCEVPTSTAIGAGYTNTQAILAADHSGIELTATNCAAKACAEYSTDTTTAGEWFLPSHNEGHKMNGYISITVNEYLWVSNNSLYNTDGNDKAGYVMLSPNANSFSSGGWQKQTSGFVRAVHAF